MRGPPPVDLVWPMFEAINSSDHWSKVLDFYITLPEVDRHATEPVQGFTRLFGAVSVMYRYGLDPKPDRTFSFDLVPDDILQFWRDVMDRKIPLSFSPQPLA